MHFMTAYNHLDTLCKERNGTGISGYIAEMHKESDAAASVKGWQQDYQKLKRYRWVQNKLTQDSSAAQEGLWEDADVQWLKGFYHRLMTKTDPLALYQKAQAAPAAPVRQSHKGLVLRLLGFLMLLGAVVFLSIALTHPERSWPWSNWISYLLYTVYLLVMVLLLIQPKKKQ